jgi:hypothetical protein
MFRESDYNTGSIHEKVMLPKLIEYFNDATLQLTSKTCIFDFKGDNKFIELKKRTFNSDKYPDTMIGLNKIEYCKGKEAECYFVFSFTDGDYIYRYNDTDQLNYRSGGRRDRGYNEYKSYCYIPINLLKKF